MLPDDPRLQAAIESVAAGCGVASAVQADLDRVRQITKDDRSPVTVADFAVQAVIARALQEQLGEALIVGEERADALRDDAHATQRHAVVEAVRSAGEENVSEADVLDAIDACAHTGGSGAYWTLDPIDGTKGFLRGQQFAIALAWIENGRVVHGVMGCPNLPPDRDAEIDGPGPRGVIAVASIGAGAWQMEITGGGELLPMRAAPDVTDGVIRVCESVEAAHSKQSDTRRILDRLGHDDRPVRLDSQCKYAIVARNQADAYLRLPTRRDYVEKIWDHAAGSLVATESGALVSDITGAPLDFSHGSRLEANRGIICAAAGLHGAIIRAIEDLGIAAAV